MRSPKKNPKSLRYAAALVAVAVVLWSYSLRSKRIQHTEPSRIESVSIAPDAANSTFATQRLPASPAGPIADSNSAPRFDLVGTTLSAQSENDTIVPPKKFQPLVRKNEVSSSRGFKPLPNASTPPPVQAERNTPQELRLASERLAPSAVSNQFRPRVAQARKNLIQSEDREIHPRRLSRQRMLAQQNGFENSAQRTSTATTLHLNASESASTQPDHDIAEQQLEFDPYARVAASLPIANLPKTDHSVLQATAMVKTPEPPPQSGGPSQSEQGTTSYRLAGQPKIGDHYKDETPLFDRNATQVESLVHDFSPDPIIKDYPYDPYANQSIYQNKTLNANQRPLLELGRPWYQLGQLSPGSSILGFHNNVNPQFLIFGDYRQAIASNRVGGDSTSQVAFELNTIWNLFITSTERVVWGVAPFDNGVQNTRWDFDADRFEFETDFDFDFGYFEGDLGAIAGGITGQTLPFDAPFAIGLTPILIQNGVWLNDAVEGLFFTIPARNSAKLGISNMDISFGYVWDEISSAAFADDDSAAKAYLIYSFIEALNGYIEIDYAFLEDRTFEDRSYHNIGLAYTRRFGNFISHSTRVIANAGQEAVDQTADGLLLLSENSLITSNPYTVIPYFNMFAGFDMPQSVAGDQQLVNTGILFESDGLTGYPTLDPTANDTFGGAIGLNLLAQDFSQQLILEAAAVFRGDDSDLAGDQYGLGFRYQIPLSNSWIFRTDGMLGFFRGTDDANGIRMELRKKF